MPVSLVLHCHTKKDVMQHAFGPALKSLEWSDFTSNGADKSGCALALAFGVMAAGASSTMGADKLNNHSLHSRLLVGACVGSMAGGATTAGCSNRNTTLALGGVVLGFFVGAFGGFSLSSEMKEDKKKGSKTGGGRKERSLKDASADDDEATKDVDTSSPAKDAMSMADKLKAFRGECPWTDCSCGDGCECGKDCGCGTIKK